MVRKSAACIVLALIALSGCSSSGDNDSAGGNDGKLTKVVVGVPALSATFANLFVGIDRGIYKKHGLDVSVRQVLGAQTVAGLKSGHMDIMDSPATSGATAIMSGDDFRFIAMPAKSLNLQVWAQEDIDSVADLKGKKVAIAPPGSLSYIALPDALKAANLSVSDVTPVLLDQPGQMAAMKSNSVDAMIGSPPLGTQLRGQGKHMIADLSNIAFPTNTYTVTSKYLAANQDTLKAFVAAEAEILPLLHSDKDETIESIRKHTGVEDQAALDEAYTFFSNVWASSPDVDEDLVALGFAKSAAALKKTPPADVSSYIVYSQLAAK